MGSMRLVNEDDRAVVERLLPGCAAHARVVRVPLGEAAITDALQRFVEALPQALEQARGEALVTPPTDTWAPRSASIQLEHYERRGPLPRSFEPSLLCRKQTVLTVRWEPDAQGHAVALASLFREQEVDHRATEQLRQRGLAGPRQFAHRWAGPPSPSALDPWPLERLCAWLRAEEAPR
jgi:hypothetical protein